jgi:hypothetical protein
VPPHVASQRLARLEGELPLVGLVLLERLGGGEAELEAVGATAAAEVAGPVTAWNVGKARWQVFQTKSPSPDVATLRFDEPVEEAEVDIDEESVVRDSARDTCSSSLGCFIVDLSFSPCLMSRVASEWMMREQMGELIWCRLSWWWLLKKEPKTPPRFA